jgi:hypothetical protein
MVIYSDEAKRYIEKKRFQIINMSTHHKCFSLGISLTRKYIQLHFLWFVIVIGDNLYHSLDFIEKNPYYTD